MKKTLLVLFLVLLMFLISGCVANNSMPSYVIMMTDYFGYIREGCTGVAVDATHIVSAAHCKELVRVVTQSGREHHVVAVQTWKDYDLLLAEVKPAFTLPEYAVFGDAASGVGGAMYGNCPYYYNFTPRFVVSGIREEVTLSDGEVFKDLQGWTQGRYEKDVSCPGDSGGVVIVNQKVAGIISTGRVDNPFMIFSREFYAVPGERIVELIYGDK